MGSKSVSDEEYMLKQSLGFDSIYMKRKVFSEKERKERKLCYLNKYCVYESRLHKYEPCYWVTEKLGSGSFGEAFKIKVKAGIYKGRIFALKRCNLGGKMKFNLDMLREVVAMMKLNNASIIKYYQYWLEYFESGKIVLNLCMQLADENLRNWMVRNSRKEYKKIIHLIAYICEALDDIHSKGIVHRDLKPENILLLDGTCKLSDFGSAAICETKPDSSEESLKSFIGSYRYIAPEIINEEQYTNKVDIFSLGIICMELMVKFENEQEFLKAVEILRNDNLLPGMFSSHFIEEGKLILAMTNLNPKERPDIEEVVSSFGFITTLREMNEETKIGDQSNCEENITNMLVALKTKLKDQGITGLSLAYNAGLLGTFGNFDHSAQVKRDILNEGKFRDASLQESGDGNEFIMKKFELGKYTHKKINKLLKEIVEICKFSKSEITKVYKSIQFFRSHFDLKQLTLFTQNDYCKDSLANWLENNKDRLENPNDLGLQKALKLFDHILNGLTGLKLIKIVHRDLKPSKIFLSFDHRWKITDSGLSSLRLMEYECEQDYYQSLIANKDVPVYAAPEQVKYLQDDSSIYEKCTSQYVTDLFSFGLIMIEYFTPLYSSVELSQAFDNVRNKYILPDTMDLSFFESKLHELILGMVKMNPHERLDIKEIWEKYYMLEKFKKMKNKFDEYHFGSKICQEGVEQRYYANGLQKITNKIELLDENRFFIKNNYELNIISTLKHLDLSNCRLIDQGEALIQLCNLKTLILHNCPQLDSSIDYIVQINSLRYLDLSSTHQDSIYYGHCYEQPSDQFKLIIKCLKNLTHLDISGTNLAVIDKETNQIVGLSLLSAPLDFLGLYKTGTAKCVQNISAAKIKKIAGDANESQVLTACEVYMDRIYFHLQAISDLTSLLESGVQISDIDRALDVIFLSLSRHQQYQMIQEFSSQLLKSIIERKKFINEEIVGEKKNKIICCLLDTIIAHENNKEIMMHCFGTLILFDFPNDIMHEFSRLIKICLKCMQNEESILIQQTSIEMLLLLASQVDSRHKIIMGDLNVIENILDVIISLRENNDYNENFVKMVKNFWMILSSLTDEMPINCQLFLTNNGMNEFVNCFQILNLNKGFMQEMLIVISNVSECVHLRHHLMVKEYVDIFMELTREEYNENCLSFTATSILAQITSSGSKLWQNHIQETFNRDQVLSLLENTVSRWKINTKLSLNYKSLMPFLNLLRSDEECHETQYWAVWSLANLTRVKCSQYCCMLENEGGIEILDDLVKSSSTNESVRSLARLILLQFRKFKDDANLNGLEDSDETDLNIVRRMIGIRNS